MVIARFYQENEVRCARRVLVEILDEFRYGRAAGRFQENGVHREVAEVVSTFVRSDLSTCVIIESTFVQKFLTNSVTGALPAVLKKMASIAR